MKDVDRIMVRPATPSDVDALVVFGERTFRAAFEREVGGPAFDKYLSEAFTPERLAAEMADSGGSFWVAFEEDQLVGYARLNEENGPGTNGRALRLYRIYADSGKIGSGIGAALMRRCIEEAHQGGFQTLWLRVWDQNARAIDFYQRFGFVNVGAIEFEMIGEIRRDLVMSRRIF